VTAPFVAQLRTRADEIRLGTPDEPVVTLRVQVADAWDTVRVDAPPDTPVAEIKRRALAVMAPDARHPEDWVVKLNGWEVLDERQSVTQVGAKNGSTFLLHVRRRRPVR
jgi:hypothetical protein